VIGEKEDIGFQGQAAFSFPSGSADQGLVVFLQTKHQFAAMEGLGPGFVANHFDVVPVRTNDESRIVVRVVVRAQTWRTIVFATRLQRRAIESFDLLTILGHECQMKMRRLLLGLVQAQGGLTFASDQLDSIGRRPL